MIISAKQTESWLAPYANTALPGQNLNWLQQMRQTALDNFEQIGLPGIRDEQWRYTNLRDLKNNAYTLSSPSAGNTPDSVSLQDSDNPRIVFVDGFYNQALSQLKSQIG